ncbi:MAG: hypothetical protein O2868_06980 [Proteobacteria bacterium]|jgi:hypothetical protein|nr:hypothetical protein [Pseudomonadota bacterium]
MNSQLSQDAFERAVEFILVNGTNLHRHRLDFHFGSGHLCGVTEALLACQNADGGFGHGIEPDLRTTNSSVVSTTVALRIALEIGLPGRHPAIVSAMDYLLAQYRHENWPLINADTNDAPHAPWWAYDPKWKCRSHGFLANPGAEITGYLMTFPNTSTAAQRGLLVKRALAHIETGRVDMHELLCYLRLYDHLEPQHQADLLPHLLTAAFDIVKVTERDWEEYCLTPSDVVQYPESPLAMFFEDSLDADFAYRIAQQRADGGWAPTWSWGGAYPATWEVVESEISAGLTLDFLVRLKAFNLVQ